MQQNPFSRSQSKQTYKYAMAHEKLSELKCTPTATGFLKKKQENDQNSIWYMEEEIALPDVY